MNNAESMEKQINKADIFNYIQLVGSTIASGYIEARSSQLNTLKSIIPDTKKDSNLTLLAAYQIISDTETKNQPIAQLDARILCLSYQVTAALEWKLAVDTSLLWNEIIWNLVEFTGENEMSAKQVETILLIFYLLVEKLVSHKSLPATKKDLINECLIVKQNTLLFY